MFGGKRKNYFRYSWKCGRCRFKKFVHFRTQGITQLLTLLFSIAALRVDESAKAPSATVVPKTDITPEDRSGRRQVTVMFSDLGLKAFSASSRVFDLIADVSWAAASC